MTRQNKNDKNRRNIVSKKSMNLFFLHISILVDSACLVHMQQMPAK